MPLHTHSFREITNSEQEPLKALTPEGGAYLNEAHYGEPDWEKTFWGENYGRLLKVKERWDETHIFDCWKCVGWRGAAE